MHQIEDSLSTLRELVQNGTNVLLQMEVDCFTRINLTTCGEIIEGHTAFRNVLQEVAEHFAQAEYLESILNGRFSSIKVIETKLLEVASEIKILDARITRMNQIEIADSIDKSTSSDPDTTSCPGIGQIMFAFDSKDIDYCSPEYTNSADQLKCFDSEVPVNATRKSIWNVHSCSVDNELQSFGSFENFSEVMNSNPVKITASLLKVSVQRPWYDISIFKDTNHFTMVSMEVSLLYVAIIIVSVWL